MVDKPTGPTPPSSHTPIQGIEKSSPKPFSSESGQWNTKPMTFLGMYFDADQAKKLWNTIIQNICNAINKDKEKALKALKKLRADSEEDS